MSTSLDSRILKPEKCTQQNKFLILRIQFVYKLTHKNKIHYSHPK